MTNYPGQPDKHGVLASAFYVSSISVPEDMSVARPRAWFCLESGTWERERKLPSRGEYLVEHPGAGTVRVRAVLTLQSPFLVWIGGDPLLPGDGPITFSSVNRIVRRSKCLHAADTPPGCHG